VDTAKREIVFATPEWEGKDDVGMHPHLTKFFSV
jgi:hypothetical protein